MSHYHTHSNSWATFLLAYAWTVHLEQLTLKKKQLIYKLLLNLLTVKSAIPDAAI